MKNIFIPYYINQDRLFDLYSILNGGYSEYEEITAGTTSDVGAKAKLGSSIKFMRIEGDVEGKKGSQTGKKEKKVQTLASILNIVLEQLNEEKHICDIDAANTGSFICLPVTMKLNSLNEFIYETSKIINLTKKIENLGENKKKNSPLSSAERQINDLLEITKTSESGKELLFESDKYALVGNYYDEYLYRTTRTGIVGKEMICFAQVSRKQESGAQLLQNSVFSKVKAEELDAFFSEIDNVINNDIYKYDTAVTSKIEGKPVYEIEIIALFQQEE